MEFRKARFSSEMEISGKLAGCIEYLVTLVTGYYSLSAPPCVCSHPFGMILAGNSLQA